MTVYLYLKQKIIKYKYTNEFKYNATTTATQV